MLLAAAACVLPGAWTIGAQPAAGASGPPQATTSQATDPQATAATGPVLDGHSYSLLTTSGQLVGLGAAVSGHAPTPPLAPLVGVAATPDGEGAWGVEANGGIETFGDATGFGSMAGHPLTEPVVGMAATPTGGGYWEVASDGGIFTFGNAAFYGSMGGSHLNEPIVGMAATPTGGGYWEVASDGGIFTFGNAPFYGSGASLGQAFAGMAVEVGGYRNPLRAVSGLAPERIDQGVDYGGGGPIYAIGDGVVLNTTNAGWPGGGFITYQLADGPAAGDIVYVAENVVPSVTVGQTVSSSTVLGTLVNAYPNLETGWAAPPGNGESLARASGQWSTAAEAGTLPTAYGANFSALLAALGAPPGISYGPVQGTVPAGWPAW